MASAPTAVLSTTAADLAWGGMQGQGAASGGAQQAPHSRSLAGASLRAADLERGQPVVRLPGDTVTQAGDNGDAQGVSGGSPAVAVLIAPPPCTLGSISAGLPCLEAAT